MSIYVKQVYELAKARGVPATEFVKQLNELGFECKSHLQRLTQADVDRIALLLNPGEAPKKETSANPIEEFKAPECASVVITKRGEHDFLVSAVQSTVVNGELIVEELERREGFRSKAEALLESDLVSYKYKTDISF